MNSISYKEAATILKKNIRLILLITFLFCIIAGGYKSIQGIRSMDVSEVSGEEMEDYSEKMEIYNQEKEDISEITSDLENNIESAYRFANENPVMSLDPSNCNYTVLVIDFAEAYASRDDAIRGIIAGADAKDIFGVSDELADKYKYDLAFVRGSGTVGEAAVYLYNVIGIDANASAHRLSKIIISDSYLSKIISGISVSDYHGVCQTLYNRQREIRNNAVTLQSDLRYIKEQGRMIEAPSISSTAPDRNAVIRTSAKFAILGAILGALIGILLVLFKVTQGGYVVSDKQIDDLFDIEHIGVIGKSEKENELLKASLDAISGHQGKVLMLDRDESKLVSQFVTSMNKAQCGEITYQIGKDIVEDKETIGRMSSIDKMIFVVNKGNTTIADIQRQIKRATVLGIPIIGYITIE